MKHKFWIQTWGGHPFFPYDPKPDQIHIRDIAHALSQQCRYAGHTNEFYSVAQHSVIVSKMVPQEHAMCALLHDATEAYLSDIPKPVKMGLPDFNALEDRVWREAIAPAFGLPEVMPKEVKSADYRILAVEKRDLLNDYQGLDWNLDFDISDEPKIYPFLPKLAEDMFMNRFHELNKEKDD